MAKKEMHSEKSEMKMDKAQDKAMIKKAFRQHDIQEHKGGKGTKLTLKKGGSAMCGGGRTKKMAAGGSTGSFNSTGSNPYAPAMQTGAIGGLDQLNQSLGTIKNALGGNPSNVGESTQMYKRGGKVKKMADGGMPIDPRAAAMAQKQAAMARGAKRGMPMARPQAPQMAGMPQGKPMVGRMPPQANMPVPTMKKGGTAKMKSGGACMARGGGIETKGKTKGKMVKMATGGSVGSASRRADGCATKGKTKGKMVSMKNGGKC
jgi:hypothetical protein